MTDWITWNGGPCPVAPETMVELRFRTGEEHAALPSAGFWTWGHDGISSDIIAYRIAKEPKT